MNLVRDVWIRERALVGLDGSPRAAASENRSDRWWRSLRSTATCVPTRDPGDHDQRAAVAPQQVLARCHELAHALVRADRRDDDPTLMYAGEE